VLLVSIIINNYNYEQFLATAIDSALQQTYPHVEVIVVDDGSTDRSREMITGYGDRIRAIFQPNGKQAAALNSGFAASTGDLILFLDSDDYLFPEVAARLVEAWKPGVGKLHGRLQVVGTEGDPLGYCYPASGQTLATGEVWRKLLQTSSYTGVPMSGNAYHRSALTPFFPIPDAYKMTADDYLMISTPFYGEVVGLEEPIGAYRIHNSNQWALSAVSGSRFRRFVNHDLQNFALLVQRAQEFNHLVPPDLEQRSLGRFWSRLASLRLEPAEHPVPSDQILDLVRWGFYALWKFSSHNLPKRLIYSVLVLWVAFMPVPLAQMGMSWLYAPHLRPKLIDQTLTKLRSLVSA